jgi:uncharacterized protein (DUF2147 family)
MVRDIRSPRSLCVIAAVAIAMIAPFASARPSSPVGTWSTENGHGVVAIEPCGDAICGRIVGIDRHPAEPMPTDINGRSQCGLTIITNQKPKSDGTWVGEITDPRDGRIWQARISLDDEGNLRLRGFVGIPLLGATQVWHKFTGRLSAECGLT